MIYIGIDPGKSGGIAMLNAEPTAGWPDQVRAMKMPDTAAGVARLFYDFSAEGCYSAKVVLEKVQAFAPAGMRMGATSAMTFGKGVGVLMGVLAAYTIDFDEVSPQRWQTALGCMSGGDKNVTKARAQNLFAKLTVTHAIADALLLAEYCRRLHTGRLDTSANGVSAHGKEKQGPRHTEKGKTARR